jgi:hypothetical protein
VKKILFVIILWLVLCPVIFATAVRPVIVVPTSDSTTAITPPSNSGLATCSTLTHVYCATASVVHTLLVPLWQNTTLGGSVTITDSGNGGGVVRFKPVAGDEGNYKIWILSTDTATGDSKGQAESTLIDYTVSDTSKHFSYIITEINNDPEHARLVCNNGSIHSVGNLIVDSVIANSTAILPSIAIDKFSQYYTASKAKLMRTSDTCHYVIFAQVSMDNSSWATVDSSCPAIGDSTYYVKTWTLPKANWFRPIIYGRRANDSCWVLVTNTFVK